MSLPKILSQKNILSADLFDIVEIEIEKNGKEFIHRNVVEDDIVIVVAINSSREIYMVSQYRYMVGKTLLECVAGFIDKDEDSNKAAERELSEELGLTAKKIEHVATFERAGSVVVGKIHIYLATGISEGKQNLDDFEEIGIVKMKWEEVMNKIFDGEIVTVGTISAIMVVDNYIKKRNIEI